MYPLRQSRLTSNEVNAYYGRSKRSLRVGQRAYFGRSKTTLFKSFPQLILYDAKADEQILEK